MEDDSGFMDRLGRPKPRPPRTGQASNLQRQPAVGVLIASQLRDVESLSKLLADLQIQTCRPGEVVLAIQNPGQEDAEFTSTLTELVDRHRAHMNLRVGVFDEVGLSRNRNRALDMARTEVCLIADDDIRLETTAISTVASAFAGHPDAAIITFQMSSPGRQRRRTEASSRIHTWRSIATVASPEIAVQRTRLGDLGVRFDERFGLGSGCWTSGEENILLADVMRFGERVYAVQKVIAHHAQTGSGQRLDERAMYGKGALFARMYGARGLPLLIAFIVKKIAERRLRTGRQSLSKAVEGYRDFRHEQRRDDARR